ncbi:hypothetical protein [Saccharibacillus brassicae]|uniref:Type II toxin-antitoxin system PemK/MazF family toxin n=1 Tax=Saccharibacillus brassicae TaxID=2583377 RepID=A0A4Y6UU54_SACBS|nr:hypothetical protein [Saccharibacillus brassicae]QDH19545.1 hypothetical protein FFV09_00945 [Saccharibacillus brassicae]
MSSNDSTRKAEAAKRKLEAQRRDAKHGEFFFAKYAAIGQPERQAPVFVVVDSDRLDVVVCSCTTSPGRGGFDITVTLKKPTTIRTNKLYTISRDQLLFKIPQTATPDEYAAIMSKLKEAIHVV